MTLVQHTVFWWTEGNPNVWYGGESSVSSNILIYADSGKIVACMF